MKKALLLVLLCVLILLSLCGCRGQEDHLEGTPIVKVVLKNYSEEESYYIVDDQQHAEKTEAFTPDSRATCFCADTHADFSCDITDGKIVNTLIATTGTDSSGNPVTADSITAEIMQVAAETIDHDIYNFFVWNVEGNYYVFLSLNVNWQDPCTLYSYNTEAKKLTKLYEWQSMELVGISTDVN